MLHPQTVLLAAAFLLPLQSDQSDQPELCCLDQLRSLALSQ